MQGTLSPASGRGVANAVIATAALVPVDVASSAGTVTVTVTAGSGVVVDVVVLVVLLLVSQPRPNQLPACDSARGRGNAGGAPRAHGIKFRALECSVQMLESFLQGKFL